MADIKKKILFIVNPISGGVRKAGVVQKIQRLMDHNKFDVTVRFTESAGHATEIAAEAVKEGFPYVVAAGGDGTINEIGRALIHSDTALGVIPLGSGNGLARHLKLPLNTEKAIQLLNNAKVKAIDAGMMNEKAFFCTAGIGFDAHIGKIFAGIKGRGFRGYISAVIREFAKYKPWNYKIHLKDRVFEHKAFLITFANASQYGNNAYIAPKAQTDDGKLQVCIFKPFPLYAMPGLAIRIFTKRIDRSSYMDTHDATELKVEREREGPVHMDGEPYEMGKDINVCILPGALHVLLPQ